MRIIQGVIIGIIIFKILLEIGYWGIKKELHTITVNLQMQQYLQEFMLNNEIQVRKGKRYAYDIFHKCIIIKSNTIDFLDDYCIFLHEYGHYRDLYNKKGDYHNFLIIIKTCQPIFFIFIVILSIGIKIFNISIKILIFLLLLELLFVIIDFIISIRLEIEANKEAIHILKKQTDIHMRLCMLFYCVAMIIQFIDRFFLVLFVLLLIYIINI